MRKFPKMSRLAGIVNDEGRSLAHDIDVMGHAGNRESFAAAKRAAQEKIQALHAFVSQATFEQSQDDSPLDDLGSGNVGEFLYDVLRTGR